MFKRATLSLFAGGLWFFVGFSLFIVGLSLLNKGAQLLPSLAYDGSFSIIAFFTSFSLSVPESQKLAIVLAMAIGFLKGRTVLKKSVNRQVARLSKLPERASIFSTFSPAFYILIGGMMTLGMSLRFAPIFYDTRGFIDLAVGFALINGAMHYMRCYQSLKYPTSLNTA